jgi:hypothetical protein
VRLPPAPGETRGHRVIDTHLPDGQDIADPGCELALDPAEVYLVNPRSAMVQRARRPGTAA